MSSGRGVDVDAVLALLRAAAAADGVRPLSEEAELRLQHGTPGGSDLVVHDDGALAGYARYDDGSAELVVHPELRRRGHGRALLGELLELAGDRPLDVWAHGDLPGSAELLSAHGFERARVLLQMRRDLAGTDPDPQPRLPGDVRVLPFRPGVDEEAWLRVNARAFDWHPEQGRMTRADLELREAEPWFDPAGFLMAWRGDPDDGGTLLGSHWTKVHPAGDAGPDPVGEIYVLGVDPDAQGLRLGGALTDLGLAHLHRQGLGSVLLYVEEDNTAAVRLYERRGFTRYAVDVSWRRTPA
ncbi:mycothiol synthase [Blastococcus sp. TML/M2B]|uniref:mycothiol synthase n=1 Tax=unclassified Blastococcus TaxID=2619396 RepID=UPI0019099A0C|nr:MULTISPECIES: mycothiol synthase [unclassified Blastococcus]MBN1094125.1 mycothiol synthase [Blastococcus sp. TML/M2B]MBN1095754.1 mycothiol synthase [Blastococcus sp. TML/C7B]